MMRKCHLNTCPVGIATQDPVLRKRFTGTPEQVINYFFFVAEELRAIMAKLGFRKLDEMVGRAECIVKRPLEHPKARLLDFERVLMPAVAAERIEEDPDASDPSQRPPLDLLAPSSTDEKLLEGTLMSVKYGESSSVQIQLTNADRAFGARLAGEIARKHGVDGLRPDTISVEATGTAGQSFGAFATRGMLLVLEGDANDYVGKGLSGGVLVVKPPVRSTFKAHENVIVGNTCLYGATSGKAFFAGRGGERFAVRNSGAIAVVEGVGDHGCEYMTGGTVVVLGPTGRNFAAGMSGGIAYVADDDRALAARCSQATVDLEPLTPEDEEIVRALIEEHVEHTRSAHGKHMLTGSLKRRFVKVMPHEWRRALQQRALKPAAKVAASHG
jgi:glutamate synthase (NADPH/NADH) large chain